MTEHLQYDTWPESPADEGTTEPGHRSGRHPLNVSHLVMGVAFLGLVGVWAVVAEGSLAGDDVRWLLPVPWVLAGLAGLLAMAFGRRRTQDR